MINILKITFLIFFSFIKILPAEKVSIAITGLARVGDECFLSIMLKNESNDGLAKINLTFFANNLKESLLGSSLISLSSINKLQPYLTTVPLDLEEPSLCKEVKNVDIFLESCMKKKEKKENTCNHRLVINKNNNKNRSLNLSILKNKNFYNQKENLTYNLPEIAVIVAPLNMKLAKKYSITQYKYGFVVVKNFNKILKEGDLITELEMNNIHNILDIKREINKIILEKKSSLLVNFIRENKEKLVAVSIK